MYIAIITSDGQEPTARGPFITIEDGWNYRNEVIHNENTYNWKTDFVYIVELMPT